jgi:hypothetical protein
MNALNGEILKGYTLINALDLNPGVLSINRMLIFPTVLVNRLSR